MCWMIRSSSAAQGSEWQGRSGSQEKIGTKGIRESQQFHHNPRTRFLDGVQIAVAKLQNMQQELELDSADLLHLLRATRKAQDRACKRAAARYRVLKEASEEHAQQAKLEIAKLTAEVNLLRERAEELAEAKESLQERGCALQREILVLGSKKQQGGARIQRARRAAAQWQHSETSMNDSANKGKTGEPSQAVTVAKTKMD